MAAAPSSSSSSSSLSSEEEVKLHPYQKHGPKGAYEAKQVNGTWTNGQSCRGLYVRVDMPGVPESGVKICKYSDSRTVTFTGKAPMVWPHFDTSDRVYGGYVILDRDPTLVSVQSQLKNGTLHLFFPASDGSLHFLSPPNSSLPLQPQHYDDDAVEFIELLGERFITYIEHAPEEPSGIKLRGGRPEHINWHLLSGVKGVYEHKIVNVGNNQHLIYVRLDVPMVNYQLFCITENADRSITFAVDAAQKDSMFDEGCRGYIGSLIPKCECCQYQIVQHDIRDGVIRFIASKSASADPPSNIHLYEPPSKPGEAPKPVVYRNIEVVMDKLPRRSTQCRK